MGDDTTLVLTGADNYQMWKIRILAKLRAVGASHIVTGKVTRLSKVTVVFPNPQSLFGRELGSAC